MRTTHDRRPNSERWRQLWRLLIVLRIGLLLIDSVAALGGHRAVVVAAFVLFLVAEVIRAVAVVLEDADDAGEPVALTIRRRTAKLVRRVYLLWLAISVVAVVLVAIGGVHDEDLVLLAAVWAILGLLLLLEYALTPRGRTPAFTPRQRVALAVTGAVVLVAASFIGWRTTRPEQVSAFEKDASYICRAFLPRVTAAPDLDAALAARRDMRLHLAALTPPNEPAQRIVFGHWLASLQLSEAADASGDRERARRFDVIARRGATALGLQEGCVLPGPNA